jgi:hypothetical protein
LNVTIGKYFGTLELIVCGGPRIVHVTGSPALTVSLFGTNSLTNPLGSPG